ncbi:hypothetical protein CJ030_MR8G011191 [Morella rubra]|uniref:Uncharacterized protein n=1 Tax=Morella rubra TaxID=262757 RepID=A0A6A1UVL7_9ROSI|nr:hypothetical protein CJ030_MR8G011191 [Morella rubra]
MTMRICRPVNEFSIYLHGRVFGEELSRLFLSPLFPAHPPQISHLGDGRSLVSSRPPTPFSLAPSIVAFAALGSVLGKNERWPLLSGDLQWIRPSRSSSGVPELQCCGRPDLTPTDPSGLQIVPQPFLSGTTFTWSPSAGLVTPSGKRKQGAHPPLLLAT